MAKELGWREDEIYFSIEGLMVPSCTWATQVKADTTVLIYSRHYPGLPAPPPAPPNSPKLGPIIPQILEPSPSAPLLDLQDILTADGQYRLPGCDETVFTFWGDPGNNVGLEELNIFRKVRERVPPGRW